MGEKKKGNKMMNKKAIAAFAAGATLLAGFAMATPVFAADAQAPKKEAEKKLTLEETQNAVKTAEAGLKTANEAKTAADEAAKKATEAWDAAKKSAPKGAKGDQTTHVYAKDDSVALTTEEGNTLQKFLDKQTAVTTTAADAAKAAENVKTAQAALTAARDALVKYKPETKVEVAESTLKAALVKTSADFDEANGKLEKAYAKYDAAYAEAKAAQAKLDGANAALASFKTAHDELTKADKVELAQLEKAVKDAKEDLADAVKAFNDAKTEFTKAFTGAKKAWAAYKGAFKAAKAKDAGLVAGYALPDDLEPVAANYVPGVSHVTPGSVKPGYAGKPGAAKPGQAGANGAAAGAKTTVVEKKKDGGKKLPGTGVGVTLTALAATMLAGMGAAVRKARH
ncbi:hypothetical protein HMPREF1580_01250 [Gardnerella vaginalis JCP8070]|nr:hypothetical protein HMPREF1580_01250 [Gardnerella vaginalis JCP8070]